MSPPPNSPTSSMSRAFAKLSVGDKNARMMKLNLPSTAGRNKRMMERGTEEVATKKGRTDRAQDRGSQDCHSTNSRDAERISRDERRETAASPSPAQPLRRIQAASPLSAQAHRRLRAASPSSAQTDQRIRAASPSSAQTHQRIRAASPSSAQPHRRIRAPSIASNSSNVSRPRDAQGPRPLRSIHESASARRSTPPITPSVDSAGETDATFTDAASRREAFMDALHNNADPPDYMACLKTLERAASHDQRRRAREIKRLTREKEASQQGVAGAKALADMQHREAMETFNKEKAGVEYAEKQNEERILELKAKLAEEEKVKEMILNDKSVLEQGHSNTQREICERIMAAVREVSLK
ncbi:hypothetical protein BU16DRAFT_620974 [Lophium mytilinum]|uniref:Uncharacterized protein n=1 Tax=Lophium mytilinum TaxID=390894 RepID=A0A6A6QG53_9PEZI|nr:hypothetical protein BU16DRAFT_620974 [Lophium mytilinum]